MVNVKSPHLTDLEIESMKKIILDHNRRYRQKFPRQLSTENAAIFLDKDGREYAEIVELDYEEFIEESDRFESKMDSHDENAKMEKLWKFSTPTFNIWKIKF